MENYTDFELMISRSINKLHDARRKAPTIDSTPEAPTIPVNADVTLPEDHCPMCGLGPHAPISQGLVVIDNEMNLNPKLAKHYSCRGCGWFWCVEGRHEREGN
jgi:hypothetical protein